jgi:hypothetical protein
MSWRVWLGPRPERKLNFYDFRLDEYDDDLAKLAKACAWRCPLRVHFSDPSLLGPFLKILSDEYAMTIDDVEQIKVVDK